MKVFLSWSGTKSHKVAKVIRDWLPSVIQSIVPYVSSEDIDKGTRWSTDIAKELEDSTFGILCVTKDNINAPWLTFEAGALSKTMDKSLVCPFLFDIKRSEVDGPILQFQSTILQKDDINKLLKTINKACGKEQLKEDRLDKAFEVWYPKLEEGLNKIKKTTTVSTDSAKKADLKSINSSEILEEILELSRLNQKLLRNPEMQNEKVFNEMKLLMRELYHRSDINHEISSKRTRKLMHPMFLEELMHMPPMFKNNFIGLQIILSLFKDNYPWVYDAGKEVIDILKSRKTKADKSRAVKEFTHMIEFTFDHPAMREIYGINKEFKMLFRELPHIFMRALHEEL